MTSIVKSINEYVEGALNLPLIYHDVFPGTDDGIVARHDPSSVNKEDYREGGCEGEINISFWA